jgi:transcriptional regulator with XRE-family HTH domain
MAKPKPDTTPATKVFGQRLRKLRMENTKLSQEHFADSIGIDRNVLGRIERGSSNVSLLTILKVCEGLQITVSELFDGFEAEVNSIQE